MKKMKEKEARQKEQHEEHPVRNFFYFLYTLFNVFCFCALFCALEKGQTLVVLGAGTVVAVAVPVGIVNVVFQKR